jgi:predicted TIM-barrel fold metal-dependent hydrolase
MLAGLAPLQEERFLARAGEAWQLPAGVYLETSSYGPRAVDATIRVLGVDRLLFGSDRPYAEPADLRLGPAVDTALRNTNPARLFATEVPA